MSRFRYKFTPFSLETRKSLDGSWRFTPSDECRYLKLNFNWNILFPDLCALGAEKNPLQFAESLYSFWLAFVFPRASHSCNRNSSSAIRHLESVDLIENSNINLSWEVQYNEKFMKSFGELNKSGHSLLLLIFRNISLNSSWRDLWTHPFAPSEENTQFCRGFLPVLEENFAPSRRRFRRATYFNVQRNLDKFRSEEIYVSTRIKVQTFPVTKCAIVSKLWCFII